MNKIKERPILFSAPMVRALLDGSKTQTRRIIKNPEQWKIEFDGETHWCQDQFGDHKNVVDYCPFGKVGDSLWVREKFQPFFVDDWERLDYYPNYKTGEGYKVSYPATDGIKEWLDGDEELRTACKPSIHMPRWASRINLEITNVRVERLRSISEDDAKCEGFDYPTTDGQGWKFNARHNFFFEWKKIYGPESWDSNPWVWCINFKVIKP